MNAVNSVTNAGLRRQQAGMALVVSLLFLLVLTVISVVAATNSRSALQMSLNAQDSMQSFQAAEAGVYAALAVNGRGGVTQDFFTGSSTDDVFSVYSDEEHPLRLLDSGPDSVTTDIIITADATSCPRRANASSIGLFDCDYYRIESQHEVDQRAQTQVNVGVVKTIIGKSVR